MAIGAHHDIEMLAGRVKAFAAMHARALQKNIARLLVVAIENGDEILDRRRRKDRLAAGPQHAQAFFQEGVELPLMDVLDDMRIVDQVERIVGKRQPPVDVDRHRVGDLRIEKAIERVSRSKMDLAHRMAVEIGADFPRADKMAVAQPAARHQQPEMHEGAEMPPEKIRLVLRVELAASVHHCRETALPQTARRNAWSNR